jgi:hypothetical protein
MTENTQLCARQINHGQSEIWLEADGKDLTERRTIATNEVVNVTRRHCPSDVFQEFYRAYHAAIGHIARVAVTNLDEIAAELKLKT